MVAERHDPAVAFCFNVSIDGVLEGGFSEISGIQLETEYEQYQEGGCNGYVHMLPTRTKQGNITLKRGVVDRRIWDWYFDLCRGEVHERQADIVLMDPASKKKVLSWKLIGVLPVKWQGPDLNALQDNVAVESLELTYRTMSIDNEGAE